MTATQDARPSAQNGNGGDEVALQFPCEGDLLAGILHRPAGAGSECGVVIVVGGPQTRVGSHRQFRLLAADLAAAGVPVLRFDERGMGDSEGDAPGFEHSGPDITAATDALFAQCPALREVVLWGLCDAASAIMMNAWRDPRVSGVVLLNPWVRSERSEARALMRHYYLRRLADPAFWRGLLGGRVAVGRALRGLAGNLRRAASGGRRAGAEDEQSLPFPERMRLGMERFGGDVLVILSGNDLTAAEYRDLTAARSDWRDLCAGPRWTHRDLPEATHTFSSAAWRERVAAWTREWLLEDRTGLGG